VTEEGVLQEITQKHLSVKDMDFDMSFSPWISQEHVNKYKKHVLQCVCTTSLGLAATSTLPDTDYRTFHSIFTAETAEVFGVLANFNLLDLLPQTGTITGTILTHDSNLLRALRLQIINN
jgi:hypothetical protein